MEAGKGQASETRRRNTICLGAVLDSEDNRIVWLDTALLFTHAVSRACSITTLQAALDDRWITLLLRGPSGKRGLTIPPFGGCHPETPTERPIEVRQVTEPDAIGNRADLAMAAIGAG